MAVKIKHRRYGTSVTVDDKLGAALVKHGTHSYAVATPLAESAAPPTPPAAAPQVTASTRSSAPTPPVSNKPTKSKSAAKPPKGKRAYNRRDMQAKD